MARVGVLAAVCVAALAAASCACASSVFVVDGRGWGHGIGMSQWGAYGFARHGWSYPRILRHYYPGTQLGLAPARRVRVLLAERRRGIRIGCAGAISVSDASGRGHALRPGWYRLGPRLRLPVGHERVRVRTPHGRRVRVLTVRRALRPPLVFDCPAAPLELDDRAYHGLLVVRRPAKRLAVVNSLSLEDYLRGVVGGEMPSRWSRAALEAQAVAARTYALATLKPGTGWDLYSDTRSQVYGGIAFESPRTDLAVARTRGRVVLWRGAPAATFFFSTSGGRTASIRDVWPRAEALPYLRSVPDPYEAGSPHRRWGPVTVTPRRLRARLHLRRATSLALTRTPSGRVRTVWISGRPIPASRFQAALKLRSTWFDVGRLDLRASRGRLAAGAHTTLVGRAVGTRGARLQARTASGRWRTVASVGAGWFRVRVSPRRTTLYRLETRGAALPPVRVAVRPPAARSVAAARP